jgi:N-formylglutamate deformylase
MSYAQAEIQRDLRPPWSIHEGASPIVAAAIHNGHDLRPDVDSLVAIAPDDRQREEDPFTERFALVTPNRVIVNRSRFEFDLNRPVDDAVCLDPDDCWGLEIWKEQPHKSLITGSRELHAAFYADMKGLLERTRQRYGRFVVLDIHSYNHRRGGPLATPDDPIENPDVNVGTGSLDRDRWGPLVDRFIADLASHPLGLDVGENVKFKGRHFAAWINEEFPGNGCCLAIEFKKTFMDEWTGQLDESRLNDLTAALASTIPGFKAELLRL